MRSVPRNVRKLCRQESGMIWFANGPLDMRAKCQSVRFKVFQLNSYSRMLNSNERQDQNHCSLCICSLNETIELSVMKHYDSSFVGKLILLKSNGFGLENKLNSAWYRVLNFLGWY